MYVLVCIFLVLFFVLMLVKLQSHLMETIEYVKLDELSIFVNELT